MDKRKTVLLRIAILVITLAPPDLPLPFDAIARRILKQLCPRAIP
jgi:hypothetical protein